MAGTSRYRYNVARPTPIVAAISMIVLPPSSIWRATRNLPAVITEGRPPTRPPGPGTGQAFLTLDEAIQQLRAAGLATPVVDAS